MAEKLSNSIALAGAQSGMGIASSAINNTIGSMIQTHNAKELMKEQQKYWDLQFKKQNERQNWLLSNQLKLEMDAKRQAGLSVLWNGNAPQTVGVSNPSGASANGGTGSYQGTPLDIGNLALVDAQRRNVEADTEQKIADAEKTRKDTSWVDRLNTALEKLNNSISKLNEGNDRRGDIHVQNEVDKIANDLYLGMENIRATERGQDLQLEGTEYSADKNLEGTKYSADKHLQGTKFSALASLEGTKYAADRSKEAVQYSADKGYDGAKYMTDTQLKQFTSSIINGMLGAGFSMKHAKQMCEYIATGNFESFKEDYGSWVADNAQARLVLENALTASQTASNVSLTAKNVSDIFSDWIPAPGKITRNIFSRTGDHKTMEYDAHGNPIRQSFHINR